MGPTILARRKHHDLIEVDVVGDTVKVAGRGVVVASGLLAL
jgi:hypothetical protein